jgi:hypothetical protein
MALSNGAGLAYTSTDRRGSRETSSTTAGFQFGVYLLS